MAGVSSIGQRKVSDPAAGLDEACGAEAREESAARARALRALAELRASHPLRPPTEPHHHRASRQPSKRVGFASPPKSVVFHYEALRAHQHGLLRELELVGVPWIAPAAPFDEATRRGRIVLALFSTEASPLPAGSGGEFRGWSMLASPGPANVGWVRRGYPRAPPQAW